MWLSFRSDSAPVRANGSSSIEIPVASVPSTSSLQSLATPAATTVSSSFSVTPALDEDMKTIDDSVIVLAAARAAEKAKAEEAKESKKKDDHEPPPVPYTAVFRYADRNDWIMLTIGTIGALGAGAMMPVRQLLSF